MSRPRPLLRLPDLGMRPVQLGPREPSSAPAVLVMLGLAMLAAAFAVSIVIAIWAGAALRQLLGA
jgi:hypothetical protein